MRQQSRALSQGDFNPEFYPHLYRRQFMTWYDLIIFGNGFGLNAHLTLDFPADQEEHWVRGAPGIYYRQGRHHETISIGGPDQHWFWRLNEKLLVKINATYRFGFNNFDRDHYGHLEIWNLFYTGITSHAALEYRPVYHRGLYAGIGLFQSFQVLPEVLPMCELGASLTLGLLLP
jgi:hypothetical protein